MSENVPRYAAGQPEALRLMQCPIAGFQYHGGEGCWARLRAGDGLVLRREPGNRHDPRAISVEWQDVMLGFIPREANYALSQMMDSGVRVAGRVAQLRAGTDPWQRVMIDVMAFPTPVAAPAPTLAPAERVILRAESRLVVPPLKPARAVGALTPQQRDVGLAVLRDCVPEIARRLALPVTGSRAEHGREVRAWEAVRIEIGTEGRGLRTQYLDAPASDGPGATLDLKRPLGEDGWLACFVPLIAKVCDRHGLTKENMREPLRRWNGTSLRLTFEDTMDFEALRKEALQFLAPDALARSLTNRIFDTPPSAEAFNWVCDRTTAISLCAVEHPAMLPFLRICHGEKSLRSASDPLAALHQRLVAEGIAPAAWKNLEKWGFEAFEEIGEAWWKPIPLARFANLLQRLQAQAPPPIFALFALSAVRYRDEPHAKLDFERHPLWFMRALLRELEDLDPDLFGEFHSELPAYLDWLLDACPTPDANQQRAGWAWILEQAHAYRKARELEMATPWRVPLAEMSWAGLRVVAVNSAAELAAEAAAMKNCLESYEDACRSGRMVVFSIRDRASGTRVACCAAQRNDDGSWAVLQVAGKMNAEVDEEIARIAEATVVKLNGGRGGKVPPF